MKYTKPDFDVTIYEIEDVITLSWGPADGGEGDDSDWGDF